MATFSAVTRQHILQAIAEHDARGPEDFLGVHGFARVPGDTFEHEGRVYEATAVVGVAHRYATGRVATAEEFHGGPEATAALLRRRGFEVPEPEPVRPWGAVAGRAPAARSTAPRAPRAPRAAADPARRRVPVREEVVRTCPTCFMALPATGICDNCA
ncbi:hypothetical protein [Cellulomonas endophytica]|uniref:hypothetical protein n=1 Tax=Cellulomonas endophytica TaxID=2494735 RepID=UPI001010E4A5|nr:hypothetical protein [Cellulomonas endophytica]